MPLSEHEQRLLEQLERQLSSDDPRFVSAMRGARGRGSAAQRYALGGVLVVLGLLLLIWGVAQQSTIAGIAGFLVMLAALLFALSTPRRRGPSGVVGPNGTTTPRAAAKSPTRTGEFMTKLEQRWDRRRGGYGN